MRNLTAQEVTILNSDIIPFEKFLIENGLYNSTVEQKYTPIKFGIESQQVLKGANGITNSDGSIAISDTVFLNSDLRTRTLYHELGHSLFGVRKLPSNQYDYLLAEVVNTQANNKELLPLEPVVYFRGLNCLEEYLAEKFEQTVCYYANGMNVPPQVSLLTPGICGGL